MARERIRRTRYVLLNSDVMIYEPRYKSLIEPDEFMPGGIDFGVSGAAAAGISTVPQMESESVSSALDVISDKFASSIHIIDSLLEDQLEGVMGALESGMERASRNRARRNHHLGNLFYGLTGAIKRHKIKSAVACAALIAVIIAGVRFADSFTVYEYSYNGTTLGYASSKNDVLQVLDLFGDKINDETSAEIQFDKINDVSFNKVVDADVVPDTQDEILNKFTYLRTLKGNGVVIKVDGERKVLVDTEETANQIIDDYRSAFTPEEGTEGVEVEKSDYVEKITVEPIEAEVLKFKGYDDGLEEFCEIESDGYPAATVKTVEVDTYNESVPYETEYEDNDEIYEGDTEVKIKGAAGKNKVVARVSKLNGEETDRDILSTEVISEPVTEVIYKGTKKRPSYAATGTYINPCAGTLSSGFGQRWGRLHAGLDIAAPYGTPIYAADSGTVTFSGTASGYGLLVKIDHGNGIETRYGHCSKLLVSAGQKVLQGEEIALVGSTGRSTGNHCHFEIRISGNAINPRPYVNY